MDNDFYLKNLWRWKCNLPEISENNNETHINLDDLKKTEWCDEFEKLMRNRLVMGALRYGKLKGPNKPQYDRISSLIKRAEKYKETGNLEHLVDVANMCLVEYVEGNHPNKHFDSIDDGEHAEKI